MGMLQEFKQFAMRGNVIDMAVGVIMGAGFGKIVNSLVTDVIMPPIGYVIGGVRFSDLKYTLPQWKLPLLNSESPAKDVEKLASINYGAFLQTAFDFLIIAACIFVTVKIMNMLMKKKASEPSKPAEATKQELLLTEIRDLLKAGK